MRTTSAQADIRKLRYEAKKLGYSIKLLSKKFNFLDNYAIIYNRYGIAIAIVKSIEELEYFLVCESA